MGLPGHLREEVGGGGLRGVEDCIGFFQKELGRQLVLPHRIPGRFELPTVKNGGAGEAGPGALGLAFGGVGDAQKMEVFRRGMIGLGAVISQHGLFSGLEKGKVACKHGPVAGRLGGVAGLRSPDPS